jgi:hypothetical protein
MLRSVASRLSLVLLGGVLVGLVATTGTASATPSAAPDTARHGRLGVTSVTTAPGIAGALLKAGVLPLPVPGTGFRLGLSGGLTATYGFPITSSTASLTPPSGDILHSGGVNFVGLRGGRLEIGTFDIALASGTIYATQLNFAPGRVPIFTLDLTNLKVTTRAGATVLSGIGLNLTPEAAGALNATFKLGLPAGLRFGTAVVTLKG